ncbi:MAG: GNAT family N-acetyltransferase [Proteobacteria bacterium]|nr:GNAT family N-acetyltransferase [Pseudomonadota bacterium]
MQVRSARLHDLPDLDRIALEAKSHWGYAQEQLIRWESDLRTRPETIAAWPTSVAEIEGRVAGFAQIDPTASPWELVSLWVQPGHMRQGIGAALLRTMQEVAQQSGVREIHIDSDPNALAFYIACGASVVGSVAAPIEGEPSRVRPQLRLPTSRPVGPPDALPQDNQAAARRLPPR